MHIPEGMLSQSTTIGSWIASVPVVGYAVVTVRKKMSDSRVVLMAVLAALIFALQMLNFPVAGGTSGHFAGGAAAAIILGPWAAVLIMTTVLIIQAFMFADGGVLALGANMFNMAIVGPMVGWAVYALATRIRNTRAGRSIGSFTAAWAATMAAAVCAGLMLWISGRAPIGIAVGSMAFWHAIIGVGEGLITAALVNYILSVRPDILDAPERTVSTRGVAVGMGVLAICAAALSFLASSSPDGLEYVYEKIGASYTPAELITGPMPDYAVPGLSNEVLAGVLAGLVGIVITGVALYTVTMAIRNLRATS
ncbi:MAG: PDGLE domain-containing protein [Actinomycetota bacterium]|jgi:cobalt/nickel transport system permease protein|nr:PDGLE domain-containing protein [Actinomycetota bacterium]